VDISGATTSGSGGWLGGGRRPSVAGRVTVSNGETYSVPVDDVQIMIFPDNSPVAPVYADCWGLDNQKVPSSPIPYQYGRGSCTFNAPLPTNGPSAGSTPWRTARAVVTLAGSGAKCYSDMTQLSQSGGGGGGWPWGGGGGGGGGWPWGSSGGGGGGGGWGSSGGGGGLGSSNPRSGSGSGSGMIGGSRQTTTASPTLLGGSNPTGGRKMLGLAA
jgi:hypothetical protein